MQHRFSMPPLEVDDFTQDYSSEVGLLQPNLIGGNGFTFDNTNQAHTDVSTSSFRPGYDGSSRRDMSFIGMSSEPEKAKQRRMIENLRWVGMSDKDLGASYSEEHKIIPIENISDFQRFEHQQDDDLQGNQSGHLSNDYIGLEDTEFKSFVSSFLDESGVDGIITTHSPAATDQVMEKTQVTHGLFVASHQKADTFFHRTAPSTIVQVQLNPMTSHHRCCKVLPKLNTTACTRTTVFSRDKCEIDAVVSNQRQGVSSGEEATSIATKGDRLMRKRIQNYIGVGISNGVWACITITLALCTLMVA